MDKTELRSEEELDHSPIDEKAHPVESTRTAESGDNVETLGNHLEATEDDIREAKELANSMKLDDVIQMMKNVVAIHDGDPNFPYVTLEKIKEFLANDDIPKNPDNYKSIIQELNIEAALITNNSPYAEVRGVVDNHDDPSMPASTIRAWVIGIFFSVVLAFINQLFDIRLPTIRFDTNIAQLLAFPMGKAWERWMPDALISVPFTAYKLRLNPGRFNKKEHMLIAIMANTSRSLPYTNYIIWTQVLPQYFNQQYARSFAYIIMNAMGTNFIGYGLAGLTRRFLVYPSYCVWPASLVTIALNTSLHEDDHSTVMGPFKKQWSMSRYKFFLITFIGMFVYFWFPNYIFTVLSYFSWMTWIAPNNRDLNILTGFNNGMALFNFWPTFDWNVVASMIDPLMVPSFSTFNAAAGMFFSGFIGLALWYSNIWNTGYLPIVTNRTYDHFGKLYNASRAINAKGMYDHDAYMSYSAPYIGAANALNYGFFFAIYAAVIVHVALYHRYEIVTGFRGLWNSLRKKKETDASREYSDVHNRLMAAYPEVSEWWYLATLVVSIVFGVLGIALWPTYTSPAVVLYGILLCLIFVVPIGVVMAMTGIPITLNVMAEFIGGMIVEGNALAMNFFKSYGYVTCAQALSFASDLKIAHYVKIPPRATFAGQMVATLISTIVCSGVIKFQMNIKDVCTPNAPMRLTCPGPNTFFTASLLWGTVGPLKVFGKDGQYKWLLLGFPLGIFIVVIFWGFRQWFPHSRALRQVHVIPILYGGILWAPLSFSYIWGAVPFAWLSWIYIRNRYLAFWSKYNFVLSASFSAGIGISALVMLFTVQWFRLDINWWGNDQVSVGCEAKPCLLKTLAAGERFFPWWDPNKVPAP